MPSSPLCRPRRRHFLSSLAAGAGGLVLPATTPRAQPLADLKLLQCLDTAAEHQELTRDYMTGVQLAAQAINLGGGIGGRPLRVVTMPVRAEDVGLVVARLRGEPDLMGVVGSVGDTMADAVIRATRAAGLGVAHIGPWLSDTTHDADPDVLPLFASREMQMRSVLRSLHGMGISRIGLVFDSPATQARSRQAFMDAARRIGVAATEYVAAPAAGVEGLARSMTADAPGVLCFAGGSIELALYAQALAARGLQRWIVNLGDANASLLTQLGASRGTALILTQVVPNPFSDKRPFALEYRRRLRQFGEEEPSPMSLAGWLVGRYLVRLLERLPKPGRAALLDEVRRRPSLDLDGFAVSFGAGRLRGSTLVEQTLLGRNGRLLG